MSSNNLKLHGHSIGGEPWVCELCDVEMGSFSTKIETPGKKNICVHCFDELIAKYHKISRINSINRISNMTNY
jgi:hypothetical protein